MWAQVGEETGGRLQSPPTRRTKLPGSDPGALDSAERGTRVLYARAASSAQSAVAEIQGMPFAFTSHRAGPSGERRRARSTSAANAGEGITASIRAARERFRDPMVDKRSSPRTCAALRMRVPDGRCSARCSRRSNAAVTINIRELYEALKTRKVDARKTAVSPR